MAGMNVRDRFFNHSSGQYPAMTGVNHSHKNLVLRPGDFSRPAIAGGIHSCELAAGPVDDTRPTISLVLRAGRLPSSPFLRLRPSAARGRSPAGPAASILRPLPRAPPRPRRQRKPSGGGAPRFAKAQPYVARVISTCRPGRANRAVTRMEVAMMMDLRGMDTPSRTREPAMPPVSIKMRRQRIEELRELALLFGCSRADVIRYCVSVGIPKLRQVLENREPRT